MKGIAFDWCLSGAAFDMHERLDEIMVPYLKSIQTAPPETTGAIRRDHTVKQTEKQ